MITLNHSYRKFEHGRKCDDLSIGERKHPVKVTSLSANLEKSRPESSRCGGCCDSTR